MSSSDTPASWLTPALGQLSQALGAAEPLRARGRVTSLVGLGLEARVPGVRVGELVQIHRRGAGPLLAEVVGFHGPDATLMPLGRVDGVSPEDDVLAVGRPLEVTCGDGLLGRVVDGLGEPIDGLGPIHGVRRAVMQRAPDPLTRPRITRPLATGVRAIDALLTLGEGQRVGLFAGSGVGKSTLLGQVARQAEADVFVACLIGERGREVREFLEDALGDEGRRRGVVVCATSDAPALVRLKSAHVATTIAEHFRDQGLRVLLMMDSVTRFARAGREVGLSAGEPPARRGYPPSVFAALPELLERAGTSATGSITALYTVLVEGGDMEEPVADEVRGILDGHIVLDRALGARGRWPAIDVLQSLSRVMPAVTSETQREHANALRAHLAAYESKRDLVSLGAYKAGSDPALDAAIARMPAIEAFLRQRPETRCETDDTWLGLERALGAAQD
ncbi:MAG: FliI/YscN family ATPase [Sandaracinaceae bacterium]|nr:FliI/YscN family ATPase [Sandaracinaceae bacterium]